MPAVFLATGADLTTLPFARRHLIVFPQPPGSLRNRIGRRALAHWQARGIRRCAEVWAAPFAPFAGALERLRVREERIAPIAPPLLIDTETFAPRQVSRAAALGALAPDVGERDFILFHPSRLMMRDLPVLRETGQWKRNDMLFRGFAAFKARSAGERAKLVLIDRVVSPDRDAARRLVAELGITSSVVWLRPPRPEGFTRIEMIDLYSASDVVADDFGVGWGCLGSVVMEALAMAKPLLGFVDESVAARIYPWHPVLSSSTSDGVASLLERLWRDPEWRTSCGRRGRRWVEEFHSERAAFGHATRIASLARSRGAPNDGRFRAGEG